MQASRGRPNLEVALKAVRGARCTRCHRPIAASSSTTYAIRCRRLRVCADCLRDGE